MAVSGELGLLHETVSRFINDLDERERKAQSRGDYPVWSHRSGECRRLINTTRLNDGITGQAYTQTLTASGGYGDYTWAVYSGALPTGLSFGAASAILAGTPTAATYGTVVFSVTDGEGRVAYKDLTLQVADPLQIVTTALPDGLINGTYSEAIRTSGGIEPFSGLGPDFLCVHQICILHIDMKQM